MIEFACPSCRRHYAVPDASGGRKAKCPCGQILTVPAAPVAAPVPAAPLMDDTAASARIPMRTRRLQADARDIALALANFPLIRVLSTVGEPPEVYRIDYFVQGLEPGERAGHPVSRERHTVEIQLTADYPRLAPKCRVLTPIFHPNIDPATICVGDHWTAGERLIDLVVRIAEMIGYQAYNIKSPLDGEAAMWADLHAGQLPTDGRNLHAHEEN